MVELTSVENGVDQRNSLDVVFSSLANSNRRRLIGLLIDRAPEAVAREDLATALAAGTHGLARDDVTDDERQQAMATLHHDHLPRLTAAELVELDPDDGTVILGDHPALQDSGIREIVEEKTPPSTTAESVDALFAALADSQRRTILDVLSHQYQSIQDETLARDLAAREQGTPEQDVPSTVVEDVLVALRHVQLPALADAGLIEYDPDERTVAYAGHPDLRVPWMHSELAPEFRASLTDSPPEAEVGSIEGRERIVSFGQSLCDDADEELFMMFTTTGLLEDGCFTRIEQAADRGVDVYLGTRDPTVREFVQENVTEVTLWEPDTNWLDLPVEEDNVGRLVFADREAIMVGTLGEKNDEGVHAEQAIVGEGEDNALVVVMRQLLQSRLAQFDDQQDEVESTVFF